MQTVSWNIYIDIIVLVTKIYVKVIENGVFFFFCSVMLIFNLTYTDNLISLYTLYFN